MVCSSDYKTDMQEILCALDFRSPESDNWKDCKVSKDKAYINEVAEQTASMQQQVNGLDPHQNDQLSVLPILDMARHMPGGYAEQQEGTPWALDFGLYQGDKLGKAAVSLYRKLLKELFLNRLMLRIEQQLQNNMNNTDYLYEGLKVYLMLADPAHYG